MNGGGSHKTGVAMAGLLVVCCALHLVVLPLLASGALAGLVGAMSGRALLVWGGAILLVLGAAIQVRRWRGPGRICDAVARRWYIRTVARMTPPATPR